MIELLAIPSRQQWVMPVAVKPKSVKNDWCAWQLEDIAFRIKLRAVPEKGAANAALIRFVADTLDLPPTGIVLIQGNQSRHKRLQLTTTGPHLAQALKRLAEQTQSPFEAILGIEIT